MTFHEAHRKCGGHCQADNASGRGQPSTCTADRGPQQTGAHNKAPACQQLGKVLAFLSLCAIPDNLVDAKVAVGAIAQAN